MNTTYLVEIFNLIGCFILLTAVMIISKNFILGSALMALSCMMFLAYFTIKGNKIQVLLQTILMAGHILNIVSKVIGGVI